jgi:hypothetical protein
VLIAIGAVIALMGMILPWQTAGELIGLPVVTSNGFAGAGILVFIASVGLLALILLPYASSTGRSILDRSVSFVLLGGLAVSGMAIELVRIRESLTVWPLDRTPGLWLSTLGVLLIVWGVGELLGERTSDV